MPAGNYVESFKMESLPSGLYFIMAQIGNSFKAIKLISVLEVAFQTITKNLVLKKVWGAKEFFISS